MADMSMQDLLQIPEVVEEINRHLWIESEKANQDIGFDNAAQDWVSNYSYDWLSYHKPELFSSDSNASLPSSKKGAKKKRRAKSYKI